MALRKLIRKERMICVYKKNGNDILGDDVEEIAVDPISLDTLKSIVESNHDDPMFYNGYSLTLDQITRLNKYLDQKITPHFTLFDYALECYGIYE